MNFQWFLSSVKFKFTLFNLETIYLNFQTTANTNKVCHLWNQRNISESARLTGATNFGAKTFDDLRSTPGLQRRPQADGRAQPRGGSSSQRATGQQLRSRSAPFPGFQPDRQLLVLWRRDARATRPHLRDEHSTQSGGTTASVTASEQSQIGFVPSSQGPPTTNASRGAAAPPRHHQHHPHRAVTHRDAVVFRVAVTSGSAAASHAAIALLLQPDAARGASRGDRRTLGRSRLPPDPDHRIFGAATSRPSADADGPRRPEVAQPDQDQRRADLHFGSAANPEKRFLDDHDGGHELLNQTWLWKIQIISKITRDDNVCQSWAFQMAN